MLLTTTPRYSSVLSSAHICWWAQAWLIMTDMKIHTSILAYFSATFSNNFSAYLRNIKAYFGRLLINLCAPVLVWYCIWQTYYVGRIDCVGDCCRRDSEFLNNDCPHFSIPLTPFLSLWVINTKTIYKKLRINYWSL